MNTPLFTGVCTALVTPFSDGQVNFPMLETLLQRQMDAGIRAIVLCGTTGESPTLSDKEKCRIFQHAKTYCGSRCTLLAGTGSNSTAHAVELSRRAEDAGADGLLVVSPYYTPMDCTNTIRPLPMPSGSPLSFTMSHPEPAWMFPQRFMPAYPPYPTLQE